MWTRHKMDREALADALTRSRVAGHVGTSRSNVLSRMERLIEGHPAERFGLRLDALSRTEVAAAVRDEAGLGPSAAGEPWVDPGRLCDRLAAAGARLAQAANAGERVLFATGHPVGLLLLYLSVAAALEGAGATVLTPAGGERWEERPVGSEPRTPFAVAKRLLKALRAGSAAGSVQRGVAFVGGVGVVTDGRSAYHTHSGRAMEHMLAEALPDLVVGDHGLAGTAVAAGIDTIAVADVNDPALIVAHRRGQLRHLLVMDDNSPPNAYRPCFQVLTEGLEERPATGGSTPRKLSEETGR